MNRMALLNHRSLALLAALTAAGSGALADSPAADRGQPSVGIHRLELRELWRTGGEETDVVFGAVHKVIATADGGLACLDYQQARIFLFTRDGKLGREIDLSGEGPGRVGYPADVIRLADGRFAIAQVFPASVEIFDDDWNHERSISLYSHNENEELRLEDLWEYRGGFLVAGEHIEKVRADGTFLHRRHNYVRVLSATGALQSTVYTRERVVDFSHCVYDEDQMHYVPDVAIGPAGEIYIPTKRIGYEITAFDPDGNSRAVLRRDYEPLARTKQEIDYLETSRRTMFERTFARYTLKISRYDPDISGVACTAAGEVRVTTSRSYQCEDPAVFCRYDIFAAQGRFLRQDDVVLPTAEDRSGRLFWLDDGRVVLVTGLADAWRGVHASSNNAQGALAASQVELYGEPMEMVVYEVVGVTSKGTYRRLPSPH